MIFSIIILSGAQEFFLPTVLLSTVRVKRRALWYLVIACDILQTSAMPYVVGETPQFKCQVSPGLLQRRSEKESGKICEGRRPLWEKETFVREGDPCGLESIATVHASLRY